MSSELVRRAKAGDREALARLFEYLDGKLRAFFHSHINDPNDADDVTQECLLGILRSIRNGSPPKGSVDNWALAVAWRYLSRYYESGPECKHDQHVWEFLSLDALEEDSWEEGKWS